MDATSCSPVVNCGKRGVILPAQNLVFQLASRARFSQAALGYRAIRECQGGGYGQAQWRVGLDAVEWRQRLAHWLRVVSIRLVVAMLSKPKNDAMSQGIN
jgi:hypothetical protein